MHDREESRSRSVYHDLPGRRAGRLPESPPTEPFGGRYRASTEETDSRALPSDVELYAVLGED